MNYHVHTNHYQNTSTALTADKAAKTDGYLFVYKLANLLISFEKQFG